MPVKGIAKLFRSICDIPFGGRSGGHFSGVIVPKVESIGAGVAVRRRAELMAAKAEDQVDLVMGRQKSLGLPM